MAVAHSILVIGYHLVQRDEPYHELGADYFDRRNPETTARRLVQRLEHLGYQVALQSPSE
jgi:transposase